METKYYKLKRVNKSLIDAVHVAFSVSSVDEDAVYIFHPYKLARGEAAIIDIGGYRVAGRVDPFVDGTRWCMGLPSTMYLDVTEASQLEKLMCIGGKMKTVTLVSKIYEFPSEKK
jgi:hypothetical protein